MKHLEALPVQRTDICKETRSDSTLSQVMEMATTGRFPQIHDPKNVLAPYINRKNELSSQQDCLMWGCVVVIPPKLRFRVLKELHIRHPGIVRMKAVAHSHVCWPGIDTQIKPSSKTCSLWPQTQKAPGSTPLHPGHGQDLLGMHTFGLCWSI